MTNRLRAALLAAFVALGSAGCAVPSDTELFGWHPRMLVEPSVFNGGCP
jgi:hypothetical protein